jgi:hypothetical protein
MFSFNVGTVFYDTEILIFMITKILNNIMIYSTLQLIDWNFIVNIYDGLRISDMTFAWDHKTEQNIIYPLTLIIFYIHFLIHIVINIKQKHQKHTRL